MMKLNGVPAELVEQMGEPEAPSKWTVESERRAKRTEALTLRLAGFTWEQIADRMQMSESGVKALVERTLSRAEQQNAAELREVENMRLDRAQAAIWTKVLAGDLPAVDTFLRISARRSKLNGLDAPTQIELSVNVKQEMEAALQQLEAVVLQDVYTITEVGRDGAA